jgi:hypothetical protein
MKKILAAVVALSLLMSVSAFAEESKNEEMPGMSMEKALGMPMPGMGKMCGPMMGKAQMVATDEGGVFVLVGNKLTKYDADLNIVKEAEVKMPMPPMGGKQCPMMGKMPTKDSVPGAAEAQEKIA